jgi:hypothetical protein
MKYSCSKEINQIVRHCVQRDWTFRRGAKHGLLSPPRCGLFVVVPGTPGDYRALRNFERDVNRIRELAGSAQGFRTPA